MSVTVTGSVESNAAGSTASMTAKTYKGGPVLVRICVGEAELSASLDAEDFFRLAAVMHQYAVGQK